MRSVADIFRSYAVFDAEGKHINGCDKMSNHNYGDAYESLFPERDKVKLMMEVGVADGSSLLAWRDIFPNALCVGMDIHVASRLVEEGCDTLGGPSWKFDNRLQFYLGDQRIKGDCERAAAGRQFDLIVEDATHKLENTLLTLFWLWPFVKPGGLYVVEEWEGIAGTRNNVLELWYDRSGCGEGTRAEIVGTCGPHIQDEPLVVLKKPL